MGLFRKTPNSTDVLKNTFSVFGLTIKTLSLKSAEKHWFSQFWDLFQWHLTLLRDSGNLTQEDIDAILINSKYSFYEHERTLSFFVPTQNLKRCMMLGMDLRIELKSLVLNAFTFSPMEGFKRSIFAVTKHHRFEIQEQDQTMALVNILIIALSQIVTETQDMHLEAMGKYRDNAVDFVSLFISSWLFRSNLEEDPV